MADALTALRKRRAELKEVIKVTTQHRDRYQRTVDDFQATIDRSLAEIASIDLAIEVLDAAVEYANPTTREEPTNG